ncbi:MarR family winged helix-turn-helix transcriptional regulator [Glycomyces sp. NRRL B-16210]|uniref:MarR family winged helix-turn-helix transcriptional regulator n=1 Tax=Glycomyces sp. NRRL B-16210 TaxID=1463821 RepID=UPI0004C152DA|nr:MarR family transcriptional regulator [Glycomyces sp. NRRL B-16210]
MTRSRSHLANDAWESLLTAHAALMKRFAAEPIWDEVSMREYDVLYTLSKHDGPMRLYELGRGVLLSQPALSRLVERLAERGLVERAADPADGRGLRLALTATGREAQRRVGGRHAVDVARAVHAALTDEEMRQLETIGRKLAAQGETASTHRDRQEAAL